MAQHGNGISLIFARTDTAAFHDYVWPHVDALLFLRGRITFLRPDLSSPIANSGAPSVLLAYGDHNADLLRTCGLTGHYIDQRRLR